jgi:hypothetical protein
MRARWHGTVLRHCAQGSSQTCACVINESKKLRMRDKRHGSVLNASARPTHVSVVKAEKCACAIRGMVRAQCFSQPCACVSSESRKLCMHDKRQSPVHVSVEKAENCTCALGGVTHHRGTVHRAPARPALASVEKAKSCACAIRDMDPCSMLQPDLRMCQ